MKGSTIGTLLGIATIMSGGMSFSNYRDITIKSNAPKIRGIRANVIPNKYKLSRNMKCPCGSGKKNKVCHKFIYIRKLNN